MTPTVGRIVHYVSRGSADGKYAPRHVPFLIVEVEPIGSSGHGVYFGISGWTFNPMGQRYEKFVPQDEDEKAGGTWHWPEREES